MTLQCLRDSLSSFVPRRRLGWGINCKSLPKHIIKEAKSRKIQALSLKLSQRQQDSFCKDSHQWRTEGGSGANVPGCQGEGQQNCHSPSVAPLSTPRSEGHPPPSLFFFFFKQSGRRVARGGSSESLRSCAQPPWPSQHLWKGGSRCGGQHLQVRGSTHEGVPPGTHTPRIESHPYLLRSPTVFAAMQRNAVWFPLMKQLTEGRKNLTNPVRCWRKGDSGV